MSQQLLPITNPNQTNTVNQLDGNGDTVYEALRLQFIKTSPLFYEREIARTIKLFLQSDLCSDRITGHDGESFQMVTNNADNAFQKLRRVYNLQDEFVSKVVDVMIGNLQDVFELMPNTPENTEHRTKLIIDIGLLQEKKQYYLQHENTLKLLELVKFLC